MSPSPRKKAPLLRIPFRRDGGTEEIEEELAFHIAMKSAKYEKQGMSPAEAGRAARMRLGNIDRIVEEVREVDERMKRSESRSDVIGHIRQDVAFAVRQIIKSPGMSFVVAFTIALAIAATTSVFSVVDGILLRPLAFDDPEELISVWADYTRVDVELPDLQREWLSWPNFEDFRDGVPAVSALSAYGGWRPTLTGAGDAEQINGGVFSYGMFANVLKVAPVLGRGFSPEEDQPGGARTVVLSDGMWKRVFGADSSVLGTSIVLGGEPYTVIGVMAPGFNPPDFLGSDAWTMSQMDAANGGGRGSAFLRTVGRLASGSSLSVAQAQATTLGQQLEEDFPEANQGVGYSVFSLQSDLVRHSRTAVWVLFGAAASLLLIACVNVANLLLARGADRRGELAVRVAIGARRSRILMQLLTESFVLVGIGGLIGIGLSYAGTDFLVGIAPAGTARLDTVGVDGRVLVFGFLATLVAGLVCGALPALRASKEQPSDALREGGQRQIGRTSTGLRNGLVVSQVALALVLLVSAGLMVRSFQNLQHVDLGFEPEGLLTFQTVMPRSRYEDAVSRYRFVDPLEERLRALPGVMAVGGISNLPLAGRDGDTGFDIEGQPPATARRGQVVWERRVTPGYFQAMEIEITEGRGFSSGDTGDQPQVVVINQTMADTHFEGSPLGSRINLGRPDEPTWREIVGVAGDVKNFGVRSSSRNALYLPFKQVSSGFLSTVIRTSADPVSLTGAARREAGALDPLIAVSGIQPMTQWVDESLAQERFVSTLLGWFAGVALLLAVVGLYGVIAYSVNTRRREMGVRMALGAASGSIRMLILRWVMLLAGTGIVLGAIGALAVTRLMGGLLFEVSAGDPVTFGAVVLMMAGTAGLAAVVPAMRAVRVDPARVLGSD